MLFNFGFILPDKLAGCAHPGRGQMLIESLDELARIHGITAILSLTEDPLPTQALNEFGLHYHHLPIYDFSTPSIEGLQNAMEFVSNEITQGGKVVVHCLAGQGRTGLVLSCYLISCENYTAEEAMQWVRQHRRGSVETPEQEEFIRKWEALVRKKRI